MRLFSWNVNGLRAVLRSGALEEMLNNFSPDVLCFQELKIDLESVESLRLEEKFPDYNKYYCLASRKGYSGTAIWLKRGMNSIAPMPDMTKKFFGVEDEGRIIGLEMNDFYLLNVYVPNSKRDLSRLELRKDYWGPELRELLIGLKCAKPVVICGDFNVAHQEIDLANPKANHKTHGFTDEERRDFSELLEKVDLLDTFRIFNHNGGNYTWWSPFANARACNIGWRIDYFLVSKSLRPDIKAASIHSNTFGSDHCPISLEIS